MIAKIQPHLINQFIGILQADNEKSQEQILELRTSSIDVPTKDMQRCCHEGNINQNNNMISDLKALLESYR